MRVPLLDLKAQLNVIGDELKEAVLGVLDSTCYIGGPKVEQLESEIAHYVGTEFAIGVSSGTDALLVSLMALGVGANDIVLTTPYSFFATAGAVSRLGATPQFVDIDADTFNLCPDKLRAWFEAHPDQHGDVKAIIPVHLYGQCVDMDPILAIAEEYGVPIIEDAAQAIGARYPSASGTRRAGSMGLLGCFSFFPSKNLGGIGDGGMVTTNDAELAGKIKQLRNHGAEPKYYHPIIGGNFRLDPIQAAVLSVKLQYLDSWHERRQGNAAYYDEHLRDAGVKTPVLAYDRALHIYNQYVLMTPGRRDELRAFLAENEIGHDVYYPFAFHQQECFKSLGYQLGDFPVSEDAAAQSIALPIYPELTREMQDFVIEKITAFYA